MKKLFISLMLLMLIVPSVFVLSACGKDKGYQLSNLKSDFTNIAENHENVKFENGKFVFDYSAFIYNDKEYLVELINETKPYTEIKSYTTIFDNVMVFAYDHIEICSNNSIELDIESRNNIKVKLDDLNVAVGDVATYIKQWAEIIRFESNNNISVNCLSRFKTLLDGYNTLYQKSINFSNALADLYYNHALNNSNPRIDTTKLEDFDSSIVIANLKGRIKYQISNLTQSYIEMYVDGGYLSKNITTKSGNNFGSVDLNAFNYITKINKINKNFDAAVAVEVANNNSNKQNFYNAAIEAYNLQNILNNDNEKFVKACNSVVYLNVNSESSAEEKDFKQIINDNNYIIGQYNDILAKLLAFMGVV